jgi:hypothetical protein
VWAIYVRAGRRDPFNHPEDEKVACRLSWGLGKALLVLYDDRCGLRFSALYEKGDLASEFGPSDEIWVALDERGEPDLDGERYRWEEIEDDEEGEYETIINSIDAGLEALGVLNLVDCSHLRQMVCDEFE